MVFTITVITFLYVALILAFAFGFSKIAIFKAEKLITETKFSVIIPFRNEAEQLPELLDSILKLNYVKTYFEIIFVDDDSSDNSVKIILKALEKTNVNFSIINNQRLSNSPKKDAISTAIKKAKHNWIITTDADCILPKLWLDTFNSFIQKKQCKMVVAPVTYVQLNSVLKRFQLLDFLSLIGATIGGFGLGKPFLCNGANLAYKKSLFLQLNGFTGNDTIASGDDIFLLQKAIENNKQDVRFLKSETAIVKTKPQPNLQTLISQRKRWAAKTANYNSAFGKWVGLLVLLMNVTLISAFVFVILQLLYFKFFLLIFVLKSMADFILIYKTARFFNQKKHLISFALSSFLYPFFSVYIAFISMFTKYKWKERTFDK